MYKMRDGELDFIFMHFGKGQLEVFKAMLLVVGSPCYEEARDSIEKIIAIRENLDDDADLDRDMLFEEYLLNFPDAIGELSDHHLEYLNGIFKKVIKMTEKQPFTLKAKGDDWLADEIDLTDMTYSFMDCVNQELIERQQQRKCNDALVLRNKPSRK